MSNVSWRARGCIFTTIEHRKTLVNSFRVTIIAKGILIGKFGPQSIVSIPVGPAEHQTRKEFFADSSSGHSQFDFSRIVGIRTQTVGMHGLELGGPQELLFFNHESQKKTKLQSSTSLAAFTPGKVRHF